VARPSVRLCVGLNTKAATQQEDSEEVVPSLSVVGLSPVVASASVLVHEVIHSEEFAERRLRVPKSIAPGSRSKSTARGTYSPPKTWCPSGDRTGPPACAQSRAKKQPGIGNHVGEKGRGMAEKYKELQQLSESPTISMAMPTCRAAAAA
jgi:hypothetical protein